VNEGANERKAECGSKQDSRVVRVLGVKVIRAQLEDSRSWERLGQMNENWLP
jgi:hypothetical protein